jgi:hypothetical protein
MPDKLTIDQFAQKIKDKYPEYKDIDNNELTQKVIAKYPEYKEHVDLKKKEESESVGQGSTSKSVGSDSQSTSQVEGSKELNERLFPTGEPGKITSKPKTVAEFNKENNISPEENDHKNPQMIMSSEEQEDQFGKVQSKRYIQEKSKNTKDRASDYVWGFLTGIDDATVKNLKAADGAYRMVKNVLQKTPGIVGDLTQALPQKSIWENMADHVEEAVKKGDKNYHTPEDIPGMMLHATGSLAEDVPLMLVTPEAKLGFIATATKGVIKTLPGMASYMGAQGAAETYQALDKQGIPEGKKIAETAKSLGTGVATGYLYDLFGFASSKTGKLVKGLTDSNLAGKVANIVSNGTLFGAQTATEEGLTGKISSKDVIANALLGSAMALGGKGLEEDLKYNQVKATNRLFTSTSDEIKNINEIPFTVEELRKQQIGLMDQSEKETDPQKKESLKIAANTIDGYIDIKATTKQVIADPKGYLKSIQDDTKLSNEEKQYYTQKINDIVGK